MTDENLTNLVGDRQEGPISIHLESEKVSCLLNTFSRLAKVCHDVEIINGEICQHTNSKTAIFNIDLSNIIGNISIDMISLQGKVDLLDPFKKQKVDMDLEITETKHTFKDDYSQIVFINPVKEYLNNRFISETDRDNRYIVFDPNQPIFEVEIQRFLINRMDALGRGLDSTFLQLEFTGDKCDLIVCPVGDASASTIGKILTIDLDIETTGTTVFPLDPFILGFDEISVKCYKLSTFTEANRFSRDGMTCIDSLIMVLETETDNVEYKIYCYGNLIVPNDMVPQINQ